MPEENTNTTVPADNQTQTTPAPTQDSPAPAVDSVIVDPTMPEETVDTSPAPTGKNIVAEVVNKISGSNNILIALSSDPSVDELSAAIGLSLFLDRLGKRATAIYSGATPNALEFLKPEETFEPTVDTLQDFVIALNKEKADHLRYKLDGEFVKIYITPYKTRISEEDLDFSYGDFNVDLVLALDVANGIDLDSALREHGRIMHDASIINITTGNPGKFGEIEWSDKAASSVSEMIAKMIYSIDGKNKIEKEEATAFLTGIVAATNRFSNAHTTPDTMRLSSRLMESGANQQLISKNITPDIENEMFSMLQDSTPKAKEDDPTKLDIKHDEGRSDDEESEANNDNSDKEVDATITEKESTLLDDLKAAEASLSQAGAETTPDLSNQPVNLNEPFDQETVTEPVPAEPIAAEPVPAEPVAAEPIPEPVSEEPAPEAPSSITPSPVFEPTADESSLSGEAAPTEPSINEGIVNSPEKVIQPLSSQGTNMFEENSEKYSKMLEDALNSTEPAAQPPQENMMAANPAMLNTPTTPTTPEINGIPEINYMPMPGDQTLPPPPTPPLNPDELAAPLPPTDFAAPVPASPIMPAAPVTAPVPEPLGPQPAMQDQVYAAPAADPSAFQIPGM